MNKKNIILSDIYIGGVIIFAADFISIFKRIKRLSFVKHLLTSEGIIVYDI